MATSPWLATLQDAQMLISQGVTILDPLDQASAALTLRPGADVARELCGRYLLKYLTPRQVTAEAFRHGSADASYATPTPYSTDDVSGWLLLPASHVPREDVLLLDPVKIPWIQGPLWVALGRGIQYILPYGFPEDAVIVPGAPTGHWSLPVR